MRKRIKMLACVLLAISVCSPVLAGDKVLLVHSYYSDYPWVNSITDGVRNGLEGSGAQLEIFYMDTKRKTGKEWKVKAGELARQKVAEFRPDIIIPADDNAQEYFGKYYIGKEGIQIVFTGVNEDPAKYGYPAVNATGVIQKPIFVQAVELLLSIKQDVKTMAVISDDGPTSDAVIGHMKTMKSSIKVVSFDQPSTFDEWKALIKKYQTSVDAIAVNLYQTIREKPGSMSLPQKVVMNWTMANNKLPTVGFFPDAFDDGILCGVAESGEEQGYQAAKIAAQILKGKKVADFPILAPIKGLVIINLKTAEKLGLEIPFEVIQFANKVIE